ncbi:MAG: nucleotidyltransferase family protein [Alphaproteobacteria bacterium]|nr:nucleotidyltransferase family protein [Alphaproteobacteria bacterium]
MISIAMILAAGRGVRMKNLTDNLPKPLIPVLGEPIIDGIVGKLKSHGVADIVVNTCYLGEMIKADLKKHAGVRFHFSDEAVALETGGGVKKALPLLLPKGRDGFFVTNADPLWRDKTTSVFAQLEQAWRPDAMDALLALIPLDQAFGDVSDGNYFLENGRPRRQRPGEKNIPYLFTGIQILHPRLFDGAPDGAFSVRDLYDAAEKKGRLGYIVYDGDWFHIGTPEALAETERILSP